MADKTRLMNPNLGYMFSIIFLIYEFYPYEIDDLYIPLAISILGWLFYLYAVYRILRVFYSHYSGKFPIKPIWGTRAHFIPIFNFYWVYKWPKSLADYVWKKDKFYLFDEKLLPLLMVVGIILTRIEYAIGYAVFWTGMRFVLKGVERFIGQSKTIDALL